MGIAKLTPDDTPVPEMHQNQKRKNIYLGTSIVWKLRLSNYLLQKYHMQQNFATKIT